jgi:hypothetical protein
MMIYQGTTRISTAGQWVQASKPSPPSITKVCLVRNVFVVAHRYAWVTSATVPGRCRDIIFCKWLLWSRIFKVHYFRFWPGAEVSIYRYNSPSDPIETLLGVLGLAAARELHVRHDRLSTTARCRITC